VFDPDGETLSRVRRLCDNEARLVGQAYPIAGPDHNALDGEARLKELRSECILQSFDYTFDTVRSYQIKGIRPLCFHSPRESKEEGRELTNVINVKVTDEQVGHLLPRQAVTSQRMHGTGATIEHYPRARKLDEITRRVA
jgi:hypothetical protein